MKIPGKGTRSRVGSLFCEVMLMLAALSAVMTSSGCAGGGRESFDAEDIRSFLIHAEFTYDVRYDFGTKTVKAIYNGETVEQKLGASDAALYEQAIKSMCLDAVSNRQQFYGAPGDIAFAQWWYMEIGLADGTVQPAAATSEGSRAYPEGWDDFAAMTKRLTGVPIGEEADAMIPESYRR